MALRESKLRIGVLGAGAWAARAHVPGWLRDPRCEVVAIGDVELDRAQALCEETGVSDATADWQALIARADVDVIDIATPSTTHLELALAAIEAGKHVLCEKPVAFDYRQTRRAGELARQKGLKTKLGFTFRYSPGVQYARELLDQGFVGRPFIFNGYEQNSQWINPLTPLRQVDHTRDQSTLRVSSLEGYGAPIIDIGRWWLGALDYGSVVGTMRNFVPERIVRATGQMMRMNIDDGDIFMAEFANGAIGSIQSSYVTVGNYPGVEARIYGENGSIICRLVEEYGVAETIKVARPDAVEFEELKIPERFYPTGGHAEESWRSMFYANLIKDYIDEILAGGDHNQGSFDDGAVVQEVINAVELSFRERRWVDLPLEGNVSGPDAAPAFAAWLDDFFASFWRHRPVTATFAGIHDYDDRLPDYSDRGVGDALADTETLLKRLAVLPPAPLTTEQRLDRLAAEGFLRTQLWEYDSPHFRWSNPSLHTGEAIFGVIALLHQEQTPLPQRLELVAARLAAIPALLDQARQSVRTAPAAWIERASRESVAALSVIGGGLGRYVFEHGHEQAGLRDAAEAASRAFSEFGRFLEHDLLPHATDQYGCGADVFEMLLREAHFLDTDAAGLEARARDLMAEAESALVAGAAQFGASDWQAALAGLADHHPTAERFSARFGELWHTHRAAAEANDLLTVPDWPVEWRPRPAWLVAAASALYFIPYRSPACFDRPAGGVQYIPAVPTGAPEKQTAFLRATNDQVIKQNYIVHHAGIGHHAQNWYAMQAASRVGQVAAVDGASRIAMLCGGTLAEGWASYTTDLMDEIGFLTPLETFAQQYAKLRMAARTVVDVRLHAGRFSLAEGQRFYEEKVGMGAVASYVEVVKNSLFPATGCMYLAGWDGIQRLRRAVEAREGSTFSRRRFHDRLHSFGSIPVALVAGTMLAADATG